MLLLPIVVLRVHDLPLLEVEVHFWYVMRIQAIVELVEDGAAAVVVVLGLLPRPQRPGHGHGLAPERAARPLERALELDDELEPPTCGGAVIMRLTASSIASTRRSRRRTSSSGRTA